MKQPTVVRCDEFVPPHDAQDNGRKFVACDVTVQLIEQDSSYLSTVLQDQLDKSARHLFGRDAKVSSYIIDDAVSTALTRVVWAWVD